MFVCRKGGDPDETTERTRPRQYSANGWTDVPKLQKNIVYAKLLAEVTERQEKLIETLSPEQKALFDAASQTEIDLSIENDHDLFVKGFVLGAQMMLEILTADPMEDVVR